MLCLVSGLSAADCVFRELSYFCLLAGLQCAAYRLVNSHICIYGNPSLRQGHLRVQRIEMVNPAKTGPGIYSATYSNVCLPFGMWFPCGCRGFRLFDADGG